MKDNLQKKSQVKIDLLMASGCGQCNWDRYDHDISTLMIFFIFVNTCNIN